MMTLEGLLLFAGLTLVIFLAARYFGWDED